MPDPDPDHPTTALTPPRVFRVPLHCQAHPPTLRGRAAVVPATPLQGAAGTSFCLRTRRTVPATASQLSRRTGVPRQPAGEAEWDRCGSVGVMTTLSMPAVIMLVVFGAVLGAALGWFARAATHPAADPRDTDRTVELVTQTVRADRAETTADSARALTGAVDRSLEPLSTTVARLADTVSSLQIEGARSSAQLAQQIDHMGRVSLRLGDTTAKLAQALAAPTVRGRWGEMQLRRVVELSGMVEHCDFTEQETTCRDGSVSRPDMVIRLSGGRCIVVDAKAPLVAYLDALDTADPEEHRAYLTRHANHLRGHINTLAARDYPELYSPAPEFTVLFVPADPFLDAALSVDPELLDHAFAKNIVVATPTTLIALLKTVALTWRQEAVTAQAKEIAALGATLYKRLSTVAGHLNRLGGQINKTVDTFNKTAASIDSRLMVTARQLAEMGAVDTGRSDPPSVEAATRTTRTVAGPADTGDCPGTGECTTG